MLIEGCCCGGFVFRCRVQIVFLRREYAFIGEGKGLVCVLVCALMRARVGMANLPYGLHLVEVMCRVLRLSSLLRRTCCNVISELLNVCLGLLLWGLCV